MLRPLFLAGLVVLAAPIIGCGARADLSDNAQSSGNGGAGGTGAANGSGHGTSAAHGTSAVTSGPGVTVGSGPGTTTSSGPSATSASSGPSATSASSGPGASSSSSGQICPGFGDKCSDCLSMSCPMTFCTCYNNPECLSLIKCNGACNGDQNCEQGCLTAHPNGISDLYLLSDCAGSLCPAACPNNMPVDPCSKCIFTDCPAAMNACLAEPECLLLYKCLQACGNVNLACQQACYQAHSAGVPTLQAVLTCTTTVCKMDCN